MPFFGELVWRILEAAGLDLGSDSKPESNRVLYH